MRVLAPFFLAALSASPAFAATPDCRVDRATIHGEFGRAPFAVQVADDDQTRAMGLMHVEELGTMEGMLFVYEEPRTVSFWMHNTLIPLDMIFAGPDGTILDVHENAVPLDRTGIRSEGVQFVLEINGGLSARLGIKPGDVLQHPAIGPDAALPCD